MTVRFPAAAVVVVTGGLGCAPGGAVMGRFRITVEVLPSLLDSLMPLALCVAVRVAVLDAADDDGVGLTAAVTVAPRLRLAAAAAAAADVPGPVG